MDIKKRISMGLMAVVLAFGMLGCGRVEPEVAQRQMPPEEEPVTDEVVMTIDHGSVSEEGLALTVSSTSSDHFFRYGVDFGLERYEDGEWIDLYDGSDREIILMAHYVGLGQSQEHEIHWASWLGSLPAGEYRVVNHVAKHPLDGEVLLDPVAEYDIYARFSL